MREMATSRPRLMFSVHTLEAGRGRGEGGEGRIGAGVGGRGGTGVGGRGGGRGGMGDGVEGGGGNNNFIITVFAVVIHGVVALSWSLLWLLLSWFIRQFCGSGNCCNCCCL